jgi:hypothetical protein
MEASDKGSILAAIASGEELLKKLTHEREQALSRIQTGLMRLFRFIKQLLTI